MKCQGPRLPRLGRPRPPLPPSFRRPCTATPTSLYALENVLYTCYFLGFHRVVLFQNPANKSTIIAAIAIYLSGTEVRGGTWSPRFLPGHVGAHTILYLCHLNTLHQRPARDFILHARGGFIGVPDWESYDRHTLLRKPSLLLGNGDTYYINHAQIGYVWEIKQGCYVPRAIRTYWA